MRLPHRLLHGRALAKTGVDFYLLPVYGKGKLLFHHHAARHRAHVAERGGDTIAACHRLRYGLKAHLEKAFHLRGLEFPRTGGHIRRYVFQRQALALGLYFYDIIRIDIRCQFVWIGHQGQVHLVVSCLHKSQVVFKRFIILMGCCVCESSTGGVRNRWNARGRCRQAVLLIDCLILFMILNL